MIPFCAQWRMLAFVLMQALLPPDTRAQFRSDIAEVLIPFTAVNRREQLIDGLSAADLRLFTDGKEQKIDFVSLEDGPASIVFVLDVSGSMKKPVADAREAIGRILRAATPDDEFALIEFSDQPAVTIPFTPRSSQIEERVANAATVGHTSLTDATVLALDYMAKAAHRARKGIIVVSDGQDNHSRYTQRETLRRAVESDVRIYGIELNPTFGDPTFLELLARDTGGRYFPTERRASIPDLAERIDVHRLYLLGFKAPAAHRDERSHRVELKLRSKLPSDRPKLYWKHYYRID